MTVAELKALKEGDRVVYHDGSQSPPGVGRVVFASRVCVRITWTDAAQSTLYLGHCERGDDERHTHLTLA